MKSKVKNFLHAFVAMMMSLLILPVSVSGGGINGNAAQLKLTPPLEWGFALGGYGARMSSPAEGIHDDIWVKALVLEKDGKKMAVVTMDVLGLPPNVKPQIVGQLDDPSWSEENIMLLPSHSHTSLEMFALNDKNVFDMAPIGIFQPVLLDFVVKRVADAIKAADGELEPVKIGTSDIELKGMNRNRRGNATSDESLTVTRVDLGYGTPLAVLINWTAHPTIMDDADMWVSGGWPGYLQRELEALIGNGVVAMYYNGAEGDQSVVAGEGGSRYERAERYGRAMALHAFQLYQTIEPADNVQLELNGSQIDLPEIGPHPDFMATGGKEYGLSPENIQALLQQICPVQTSITAFRIGDLVIAGAPGEMTSELGLKIKGELRKAGVKYPVIGGLANQWISYILSEEEYKKGGYEASVSFYGPELGRVIVEGMLKTAAPLCP